MARSRSLPTNLFEDPDFFERSSETQVVLLGLVLDADDAGRGLAHTGLLARKFNKDIATIEVALAELLACDILECYQVGRYSYYHLRRWLEWQTLSKPTPSKFPAPPSLNQTFSGTPPPAHPELPQNPLGNSGQVGEIPAEGEGEEEEEEEREENRKRTEGEGAISQPQKVIPFPTTSTGTAARSSSLSEDQLAALTAQLAHILKLPVSPALRRIVDDYVPYSALSLQGEADAAREWIDDRERNRKGQTMGPAFFRRWLKREVEEHLKHQVPPALATGTSGKSPFSSPPPRSSGAGRGTPAAGADQYQAFLQRRVQEVQASQAKHAQQGG